MIDFPFGVFLVTGDSVLGRPFHLWCAFHIAGSCLPEAVQAQLMSNFWQLFPEAAQAEFSPISWQLF